MTTDNLKPCCDSCGGLELIPIGIPLGTQLGARISWCSSCGLLQSFYSRRPQSRHAPSVSSNANWGNIRHGKGVRVAAIDSHLRRLVPESGPFRVIDIGSNRGDLCKWLISRNPDISITAIEPDRSITSTYADHHQITLFHGKLEEFSIEKLGNFDLVVNLHSLEHARSARSMLLTCAQLLVDDGLLLVEVPNAEIIRSEDIVEEFFIDKHSFHFDIHSLKNLFDQSELSFQYLSSTDTLNITAICSKASTESGILDEIEIDAFTGSFKPILPDEFGVYQEHVLGNRNRLKSVAQRLKNLAERQSVAIWGATRLLDALVVHGGLEPDRFTVIDDYLSGHISDVHGVRVESSAFLNHVEVDVVVILARSSESEIRTKARTLGARHIYSFRELFADS